MILSDKILIAIIIVLAVGLFILSGIAKRLPNTKWKMLYLLPAIVCVLFMTIGGTDKFMLPVYIGSAVTAVGFFRDSVNTRKISAISSAVLAVVGCVISLASPNYSAKDYIGDFEKGFASIKAHYSLAEHKQTDWDALYEKYEPKFRQITEEQDKEGNFLTWLGFCGEIKDGHVTYMSDELKDADISILKGHMGNDYGLAFLRDDQGRDVAVCVDDSLGEYGIFNGTVITSWNGKAPEESAKLSDCYDILTYPNKTNEEFYRSFLSAGIGGETAEIGFLDEKGEEKKVTLKKIGDFFDRWLMADTLLNSGIPAENCSFVKISDTAACLRVAMMVTEDSEENYVSPKNKIRKEFEALQAEGIRDVIIDLRGNSGGYIEMAKDIAELFAAEGTYPLACDGVWDSAEKKYVKTSDGKYEVSEKSTFKGEQIAGDGKIVVLVNSSTFSAGEYLAKYLGQAENVVVMGFTGTKGSVMPISLTTLKNGALCFPALLLLNEDGTVFAEADSQGNTSIPAELVPFDEAAVKAVYDNYEDPLLNSALEYLAK